MKFLHGSNLSTALVILSVGGGCGSGTDVEFADGAVEIRTTALSYALGDSLLVAITNLSEEAVFYNLCPVFLEQQIQGTWIARGTPAEGFSQDGCDAIALSLPPGQSTVLRRQIPMSVPSATYRIRFENYRIDGLPLSPEYHISNTFAVHE
jgi:hypothetical protein